MKTYHLYFIWNKQDQPPEDINHINNVSYTIIFKGRVYKFKTEAYAHMPSIYFPTTMISMEEKDNEMFDFFHRNDFIGNIIMDVYDKTLDMRIITSDKFYYWNLLNPDAL